MICFEVRKDLLKAVILGAEILLEVASTDGDRRLIENLFFEIV